MGNLVEAYEPYADSPVQRTPVYETDIFRARVRTATREECFEMKEEVAFRLAGITSQIEMAKAEAASEGRYADPAWWRSVNHAKRCWGAVDQAIAHRLSALKAQDHAAVITANNTAIKFVAEAIKELAPSTVAKIARRAGMSEGFLTKIASGTAL